MKPSPLCAELRRNTASAIGAGFCAGVADGFKIDRNLTRIGFVLWAAVLPKLALISYAAGWILLDEESINDSNHK